MSTVFAVEINAIKAIASPTFEPNTCSATSASGASLAASVSHGTTLTTESATSTYIIVEIARERIRILFKQAEAIFLKNPTRANRYVELARKIAMKVNIRLTKPQKRKFCSHCYTYLKTGTNARIRTRDKKLIIYCQKCKKYTRIPLSPLKEK